MYSSLLVSLALAQIVRGGQHALSLDLPEHFCSIPEKEILRTLSPKIKTQTHSVEGCSHHQQQHVSPKSMHSPWTEQVKCIPGENSTSTSYVYSSREFANGRGISFFTTPSIADKVVALPAFADTENRLFDKVNNFSESPWEVKVIPGRGRGIFATRTLQRGDQILADTPVGVYHMDALASDYELGYTHLHHAFDRLPKATQQLFLDTMVASGGDPIMERININAFAGEFEGSPHFLMYPETAVCR